MTKIKKTDHETSFVVMPKHLNYMGIIFGGHFMSELDLAAAVVVNRAVRRSDTADKAVTYKFSVEFLGPSFEGDIIHIKSNITEVRKKAIKVTLEAWRETREDGSRYKVAVAEAVFVTMNKNHYVYHQLEL